MVAFGVPFEGNKKLMEVVKKINENKELQTYWKCSNVMALDRMGYSDHGPMHIKIAANNALELLRLLIKKGVIPSVVKNYKLTNEDAEVIVVLAVAFHDIGHVVDRASHEAFSIPIAFNMLDKMVDEIESVKANKPIIISEVLHAIIAHQKHAIPRTIEAGVVRIADALDMAEGRARIPFSIGTVNIHSVSALAIEHVEITEGGKNAKPISVKVKLANSAGIFQIDELLKKKIKGSGLEKYIQIDVEIAGEEKKIVKKVTLEL
ncbi:MAG: HD domain-containing protein [Candidatus Micrarchaeota archaeon]